MKPCAENEGGRQVLGKLDTCLDPSLYGPAKVGADVKCFEGTLNEPAPAIIRGEAELTLAGSLAFGHLLVRRPVLRILKATRQVAAGDLQAPHRPAGGKGKPEAPGAGI